MSTLTRLWISFKVAIVSGWLAWNVLPQVDDKEGVEFRFRITER